LNDEINKLMREKHMWEVQLRNLGGPNYMRFGPRMYDEDGREVPGARGYKYFGRARELPGVKELFEDLKPKDKPDAREAGRLRAEMRKNVDADYYGYNRDEEDDVLLEYERRKEVEAVENVAKSGQGELPRGWSEIPAGWKVPDLSEVNEFLVERRKSRLLAKLG
jgi:pre-mRNA-splicing factor ISY1